MKAREEDLGSFGGRLVAAMAAAKMTGLALAEAADVDQGYISKLRSGDRQMPNADIVERLAGHLGVRGGWLARGTGPREPESPTPTVTPVDTVELNPLDAAMRDFAWPAGLAPEDAAAVTRQLRQDFFANGEGVPQSYWTQRITDVIRDVQGRTKAVFLRAPADSSEDRDASEIEAEKARQRAALGARRKKKR